MDRARQATLELLARRREVLAAGARHVGWKLGVGERERLDGSIAVGYLTSATLLAGGEAYDAGGSGVDLRADVELAVEVGGGGRPVAYAVALEIVDLSPVLASPEAVIAANVFHRAVAFGPFRHELRAGARGRAVVDGRTVAEGSVEDVAERLRAAALVLAAAGERLREGDRVITGSIVQVPIAPGVLVRGEISGLEPVELAVA